MVEKLKQNDLIEIQYTGKVKGGEIFDTNVAEEAKKINLKIQDRPLSIFIGQKMILPSIDEFLVDKEENKSYTLELSPEKAFGKRKRELVKTIPMSVFRNQNVAPKQGMVFSFDNLIGKITVVSGGRVIVDFNNPLANKDVVYEIKTKNKIINLDEKIKILIKFFFRKDLKYKLENKKLTLELPKGFGNFAEMFKPKFKDILDLELGVKEVAPIDVPEKDISEKGVRDSSNEVGEPSE